MCKMDFQFSFSLPQQNLFVITQRYMYIVVIVVLYYKRKTEQNLQKSILHSTNTPLITLSILEQRSQKLKM